MLKMSRNKRSNDIVQNENVIQAILVADNFTDNFSPFTKEYPMTLFPIVNVPLIDYALHSLSLGGVEETFLFCCTHVDKLKKHICECEKNKAEWTVTMKVNIIVSESCLSFGDALRDLDAKGLIRGDFILLSADTVCNINFKILLQEHQATVQKDKGAAMTVLLQGCGSHRRRRMNEDEIILATDKNNRILFYQKVHTNDKKIDFPLEIFLDNSRVSIINDLRDSQVTICSPSVLPLFSDNFDFQTHYDFVRGLLMNEEILASTLYWHELKQSEYAARVTDWYMYQTISHDIIHRWVYPLVPDMRICLRRAYMFSKNNVYRHKDVKLEKGSELVDSSVVAQGVTIAESSTITNSVIGENCKIGKNVRIYHSFIFPYTEIGDDTIITSTLIGFHSKIGANVKITTGNIIGSNVHVKDNVIIRAAKVKSGMTVDVNPGSMSRSFITCYRNRHVSNEENSDSDEENIVKQYRSFQIGYIDEQTDSDSCSSVSTNSDEQMSHMASPVPDDTNLFLAEVIDSLARGFEDKLQCDNLILEINSSRYAYNVTLREVNYNVVKAMLNLPFQLPGGEPYFVSIRALLIYFSPILSNYIRNETAMPDCLQALEDVAETCSELSECVAKVIHWFYEQDVLSEESIVSWHSKLNKTSRLYVKTQPFVQWLQEADEESDTTESE